MFDWEENPHLSEKQRYQQDEYAINSHQSSMMLEHWSLCLSAGIFFLCLWLNPSGAGLWAGALALCVIFGKLIFHVFRRMINKVFHDAVACGHTRESKQFTYAKKIKKCLMSTIIWGDVISMVLLMTSMMLAVYAAR